jgi:hypothetical protein
VTLGLKKDKRFHQGYYKAKNPSKYIGKEVPIYRSGIELKFFKFCDDNPNVTKWSSEPFAIPYFDVVQNKHRKYYVDNYVEIKEGTVTKKYLIEIKDIKETKKPSSKKGKRKATILFEESRYATNMCKWSSASKFCKDNKLEFLLLGYSQKDGFQSIPLNLI